MTYIEPNELPQLTKNMYQTMNKLSGKNWEETLKNHSGEIEEMLNKVKLFDIWSRALQASEPSSKLIPEIFVDTYMSVYFACIAFYKYAYVCLRSEIETVLRLVFFSTHPIEFKWWLDGNEFYRSGLKTKDVWGEGYVYFQNLPGIKEFENCCPKGKKLFKDDNKLPTMYASLSRYVHSTAMSFQTTQEEFSPAYKACLFNGWIQRFNSLQDYVNIILITGLPDEFKSLSNSEKREISEIGIHVKEYRDIVKDIIKRG